MIGLKLKLYLNSRYQWGTTDIQSCPIKLPPLFRAPVVWVVPVWLIHRLMRDWCHVYAILIELLQQKYISMHFNYLFLLLLISLETTTPHVAVSFYIRGFIYTSSYSSPTKQMTGLYIWSPTLWHASPTKQMTGLYIWSPTLWHAVYHRPAGYILCRGHGVIINSNQYNIGKNQ